MLSTDEGMTMALENGPGGLLRNDLLDQALESVPDAHDAMLQHAAVQGELSPTPSSLIRKWQHQHQHQHQQGAREPPLRSSGSSGSSGKKPVIWANASAAAGRTDAAVEHATQHNGSGPGAVEGTRSRKADEQGWFGERVGAQLAGMYSTHVAPSSYSRQLEAMARPLESIAAARPLENIDDNLHHVRCSCLT